MRASDFVLPPTMSYATDTSGSATVELRQYTLLRGRREQLIDLFERRFIEPQEACGMPILGSFRDLDDPDRFIWLRGFPDRAGRGDALARFYDGPVWQRHREEANATLQDSDDVHVLRPARPGAGFGPLPPRPSFDCLLQAPARVLGVTVASLREPADDELLAAFDRHVAERWADEDARLLACYASDPRPNDFPRLPVHEDTPVLAWFTRFRDAEASLRHAQRLARDPACLAPAWRERLLGEPTTIRLAPTFRSALR